MGTFPAPHHWPLAELISGPGPRQPVTVTVQGREPGQPRLCASWVWVDILQSFKHCTCGQVALLEKCLFLEKSLHMPLYPWRPWDEMGTLLSAIPYVEFSSDTT